MKRGMRGTSALLWDGPGYEGKGTRVGVMGARARAHGKEAHGGRVRRGMDPYSTQRERAEARATPHLSARCNPDR